MDHEAKKSRWLIPTQQLKDIPELIQHIQSFLPVKEAARTSVLSKTWLHAWSTISTLRFPNSAWITSEQERKFMNHIDRTLQRYHRHNIPIQTFFLEINIPNEKLASIAENWIRFVVSKRSLEELYLKIWTCVSSFTLTNELFSSKNLKTLSVKIDTTMIIPLWISSNPVIKCVSLRKLELIEVKISEKALQNLLSNCSLLEKINLLLDNVVKTIKVKNLPYLRELRIQSKRKNDVLEIDGVPSLRVISYDSYQELSKPFPFKTGLLGSVKVLYIEVAHIDRSFCELIKSKFPFLESLTLKINMPDVDITSASLKRLTLLMLPNRREINVRVDVSKLMFFSYDGMTIPSLSFPGIAPRKIKLRLSLRFPVNHLFFLKMREMLNLSSNFEIQIKVDKFDCLVPLNVDIDDLRERFLFPATNVQQLWLEDYSERRMRGLTQFFEALTLICHPKVVKGMSTKAFQIEQLVQGDRKPSQVTG